MVCAICGVRRPKRQCPGVRSDICTLCCGTEREETVNCPLDCPYLREAHKREKAAELDAANLPNSDIKISSAFLDENDPLLAFLGRALTESALETPGAVDYDLREALDALIRTYRALQSGVYYESRPPNPLAASICRGTQSKLEEYGRDKKIRDAAILGMLVFLQRVELGLNNGRKKGRATIGYLRGLYTGRSEAAPSLIVT